MVCGAGLACAYKLTGGVWPPTASPTHAPLTTGAHYTPQAAYSTTSMTSQTSSAPMMSVVLPFNARLFSTDIPLVGGGVRTGGCSGSLIAPMWVITAGHCFHDVHEVRVSGTPPYHMTITVGKLKDSDPGGQTAQVVDVRQSPMNDLAVVKLSTAITGVTPLTLAQQRPSVDEDLQFAGWGALSASDTDIVQSDHLKRGQFSVSEVRSTTVEATSTEPRTVENVPCPDDSGSPFFESSDERTGVLVAIVDNGPACPAPGPEILARVDVVADWIQEQIGSTTP